MNEKLDRNILIKRQKELMILTTESYLKIQLNVYLGNIVLSEFPGSSDKDNLFTATHDSISVMLNMSVFDTYIGQYHNRRRLLNQQRIRKYQSHSSQIKMIYLLGGSFSEFQTAVGGNTIIDFCVNIENILKVNSGNKFLHFVKKFMNESRSSELSKDMVQNSYLVDIAAYDISGDAGLEAMMIYIIIIIVLSIVACLALSCTIFYCCYRSSKVVVENSSMENAVITTAIAGNTTMGKDEDLFASFPTRRKGEYQPILSSVIQDSEAEGSIRNIVHAKPVP